MLFLTKIPELKAVMSRPGRIGRGSERRLRPGECSKAPVGGRTAEELSVRLTYI